MLSLKNISNKESPSYFLAFSLLLALLLHCVENGEHKFILRSHAYLSHSSDLNFNTRIVYIDEKHHKCTYKCRCSNDQVGPISYCPKHALLEVSKLLLMGLIHTKFVTLCHSALLQNTDLILLALCLYLFIAPVFFHLS